MIWFLKFCRWQLEFELAIAYSTGRSGASISQLKRDLDDTNKAILKIEINGVGV